MGGGGQKAPLGFLEQKFPGSDRLSTCLGGEHSQNKCRHLTIPAGRVPQNTCKQVMSFAQRLKSMVTPVKSAQQLGSQKHQV